MSGPECDHQGVKSDATIRPLAGPIDEDAFRVLNEEWISTHFELEEIDRRQLADPVGTYVEPGGDILLAEVDGDVVGCVAIAPDGTGAFELSKMAVRPSMRGRGLGRLLLAAAIARAQELGATSMFLGSSTRLPAAVGLYERLGFEHVPKESLHMPFARATVFMRLELEPAEAMDRRRSGYEAS